MSRRISTLFKRKEPERTQNSSSDNFLSANNDNAQYSTFNPNPNNQTPYSSNAAAYNNNGFRAASAANGDSPYRAMTASIQANSSEPRLMSQPLPYPPTPQLHHPSLQTNLNTNIGNNYTVRNRPPSSSSPSPSYGSNPSDFSVISSARDSSPRQRNVSSPDSYHPTSGQSGTPYQYRQANELPVPGNVPQMPVSNRRSLQDVQSSQGPYPNERQQAPYRAPPPAPPPSIPRKTPATRDYQAAEDLANPPNYHPQQQSQQQQHPLHNTVNSDQLRQQRQNSASKNYIRQLRHHIREKYRLDVSIWSERDVLPADRDLVKADCKKADEVMQKIMQIIQYWDEDLFDAEEWRVAKKIKESILKHPKQHQPWLECLPWDRKEEPDVPAVDEVATKMAETSLER